MPFKVRCPYSDCGKFMLVEDSDRGGSVDCLICRRSIRLDGAEGGATAGAPAASAPGASASKPPAPQPAPAQRPAVAPARPPAPAVRPPVPSTPAAGGNAGAPSFVVRRCPNCQNAMRVPATAAGQAVRCPHCSHVFS